MQNAWSEFKRFCTAHKPLLFGYLALEAVVLWLISNRETDFTLGIAANVGLGILGTFVVLFCHWRKGLGELES